MELEVDLGELVAVVAEHGWERREHGAANEADTEEADFATAYAAGLVEVFLHIVESATGAVEEDLARAGEADGA
jgi:hypothetical protein